LIFSLKMIFFVVLKLFAIALGDEWQNGGKQTSVCDSGPAERR
jgi:hypothetical protein